MCTLTEDLQATLAELDTGDTGDAATPRG